MEIRHHRHEHPLQLFEGIVHETPTNDCFICGRKLSGQIYACSSGGCSYFQIHKSCANPPRNLQHFLHPCLLTLGLTKEWYCNACFHDVSGKAYTCEKCNFTLHFGCSKVPEPKQPGREKDDQILHFSHPHPLTLFKHEGDYQQPNCCQVCAEPCSASNIYGCTKCKFFLHVSCLAMLTQKINHPSHPSCPLLLYPALYQVGHDDDAFTCTLMFYCFKCRFFLCIPCWVSPVIKLRSGIEQLTPDCSIMWKGRHWLDKKDCGVCGRPCLPPLDTGDLCMKWHQIRHFSHPSHCLSLVHIAKMGITSMRCNLCRGYCDDLTYVSYQGQCPLFLHANCAFVKPTVLSSDHHYPLTVVDNIYDDEVKCQACLGSCINSPVFRCQGLNCSYALHIWCGPLPTKIEHPCHVHSLALKDYYVTDDDVDDSNFCCHVCEELRNPRLCVYLCVEGCPMICDVKCVVSEVAASLRGERGVVELRTVGKVHCTSKVISKDQLVEMLNEMRLDRTRKYNHLQIEEKQAVNYQFTFRQFFEIMAEKVEDEPDQREARRVTESIECKDQTPLFSEEAFKNLMNKLESFDINDEKVPDHLNIITNNIEIMRVGDEFAVPSFLFHAAQYLLDTCKSLFSESEASREVKKKSFWLLCIVMEDMDTTKVMDVTEDKLCKWWGCLTWVKQAGFQVQFMLDHLHKVTRAYFALQARNALNENERELERTTKEIKELTTKREQIEKRRDFYKVIIRKPTSLMKRCLNDAGKMRWKYAAEGMISKEEGPSSNVGLHDDENEKDETHVGK